MNFERWRKNGFIVGGIGLLLAAVGLVVSREQFFRSYLWAFLFWFSLGLGCMPLLMLYHLVGGKWGMTIRRIAESGTRTIPIMALFFIPILFGIHDLYEWSHADVVAQSEALQRKQPYLNTPFWIIRAAIYFGVWLFYVRRLNTAAEDRRFERLSGPGLAVYAVTVTFAVFDWAMSLEPHWYSTIYGMLWMVSQALSALAFAVIVLTWTSKDPSQKALHDLGNLLLAFVMLWAYLSFSQLLIIWSGNLPEEIHWYLNRLDHGWEWVAMLLLLFHFAAPFFLLLSRFRKQRAQSLARVALLILAMRIVDTFWIIMPAFHESRLAIHWLDVAALAGIGGIWLAVYAGRLRQAEPLNV